MNLAQLPIAMRHLLVVLLTHDRTGSFVTAGVAGAACGIGLAVTAPLFGRLLGRFGARPVLLVAGLAHLLALVGLTVTADPVTLVVLAAGAGLATPPVLSSGRALLPALVPAAGLTRAYAVNAIAQELLYIGGPLAVTLSLTAAGAAGALLAFAAIGTAAVVANVAVVPRRGPTTAAREAGTATAFRPAVRTLIAVHFGYMTCMGAMWVLVPAFASKANQPAQAGLLVAIWSAGSLIGGLLLAARGRPRSVRRAYLLLLAALALTALPLIVPRTVPEMAVAVAVFGLPLAPWLAINDQLMARAAPAPHTAEAYGWQQTAGQIGIAAGSAMSGPIAAHAGTTVAFLVVAGALAAALGTAFRRRRTLPGRDGPSTRQAGRPGGHFSGAGTRTERPCGTARAFNRSVVPRVPPSSS
jgi:predicted MFS family arabinose efflux permease